jgi:hypothetical protein
MPLPMVHLAVAVRMHEAEGGFPTPSFLLGSIAPDAIHVRPGAGYGDKRRVHLGVTQVEAPVAQERMRDLLARCRGGGVEMAALAEGYVVHLVADRLWEQTVFRPFCESLPQGTSRDERRELYYLDTDQVDFNLYHRAPWRREVWARLAAARPVDFDPLLTADEIGRWRDRTLGWFGELKQEPGIEPASITDEVVQVFVQDAVGMAIEQLAAWRASAGRS